MAKVKTRFNKISRALSTSNHESSTVFKKRSRSISEILDSDQPSLSSVIDGGGQQFDSSSLSCSVAGESMILLYKGYTCVEEPRSSKEVLLALRSIRTTNNSSKYVTLSYSNGTLRVAEGAQEAILACPLHSIGLVSELWIERCY